MFTEERTTELGVPLVLVRIESETLPDVVIRKVSKKSKGKYVWSDCFVGLYFEENNLYSPEEFKQVYMAINKAHYVIHVLNEKYPKGKEVEL